MRNHIKYRTIFTHQKNIWEISHMPDQLIIRVWKWCNFRCIFCNVAENETVLSLKSSIQEILAMTFYKIKHTKFLSDHINVTISGGEPSIFQKETLFILKYFKVFFEKRGIHASFDMQSNASSIDKVFADSIYRLWVGQVLVSSHAHDPDIFESIIGVKYATMWPRFEWGVQYLLDAGIEVTFNIVLNRINHEHYMEHIIYLHQKYPQVELYNIWFVQPHGMAQENFKKLFSQYSDVAPVYNRVISYLKYHWKQVHSHLVGLPLCYMDDWSSSMEYWYNQWLLKAGPTDHTLIQSINDSNKMHPSSCDGCRAKRVCSGIWKEYSKLQKLKPYIYPIYSFSTVFLTEIWHIKKQYTAGDRVFFLDWDQYTQEILCEKILTIKQLGYVWLSIVLEKWKYSDCIYHFAGTNIQYIAISPRDALSIADDVANHNTKMPFQFRIQLDILIKNSENWTIKDILDFPKSSDILIRLPKSWKSEKQFYKPYIYFSL